MKSPFFFIVKGKRYNNTKDLDGKELIINVSEEESKFSNREAEVVEVPVGYTGEISIGDTLLVHHNVFKFYNDMAGRRKSDSTFFKDDLFFVGFDQFFMYKRNGIWNTHDKYCFVKPIPVEKSFIDKRGSEEPLIGIMAYTNKTLESYGIKPGDKVAFKPDSEYEFYVDGEKMYRMFDSHITVVI